MSLNDFDAAVLAAVSQLDPHAYGVPIRDRIAAILDSEPPSIGGLYTALTRLEGRALLASTLGEATPVRGGRARRLYVLTAAGVTALEEARTRIRERAERLSSTGAPLWARLIRAAIDGRWSLACSRFLP
jgi:PadR family transcriptional regulator, regulatory protein PadR